jgi:hypothetical protein
MLNYVWTTDCIETKPSKSSDCTDHKLTDEEKKTYPTADSCCYQSFIFTTEEGTIKECLPFTKSLMNQYIEMYEESKKAGEIDDYSFECPDSDSDSGSIWLSLSLSFLLFGLLF